MGCTVAELQRRMTSEEFTEWVAFWNIEPFGDTWRQSALQGWAAAVPHMKKGHKLTVESFMPNTSSKKQTVEEQQAIFKQFATAHNKSLAKQRKRKAR